MTTTNYNTAEYVQELSDAELEQINGGWFFLPFVLKAVAKIVKVAKVAAKISKAYAPGNSATATSQYVQTMTKYGVGNRIGEGLAS
ncbi:MAG: hypothetical protein ACO289_00595 [Prochlorococcaceae cyanobacterium]